jgi:hypothetical protein
MNYRREGKVDRKMGGISEVWGTKSTPRKVLKSTSIHYLRKLS